MAVIVIKPSVKVSDFDQLYKELYFIISHGGNIDLELPIKINHNFFSLTPTLVQFIATWVRSAHFGKLYLDVDENEVALKQLYEQEHIFPVLALIWNDIQIVNKKDKNLRSILRPYQNDFILNMRGIRPVKGDKMLLVNLDHFEKYLGALPVFEQKGEFITNEERLSESLKTPIFDQVLKNAKNSRITLDNDYTQIAGIIYELIKNTYDWARTDKKGTPLSPNIRGLYLRFFKKKRSLLLEEYEKDLPMRHYFQDDIMFQTNEVGQIYFLEISVFDSGIGLIQKFVDPENNSLGDIDIIKKCLVKYQTSSQGLLKEKKGIGLDRILKTIDKKGFLKIRTDKYCLYRDMIKNPYKTISREDYNDVELMDWSNLSAINFTPGFECAGTSISILFPLSNLSLS